MFIFFLKLTVLAICPNNNEIHIYGECKTANWKVLHVLQEVSIVLFQNLVKLNFIYLFVCLFIYLITA